MSSNPAAPAAPETPAQPTSRMSFEEFLNWSHEGVRAEWVDGDVRIMSPARLDHQDLVLFLGRLIAGFIEAHRLGRVFIAPVLMRLATRPSGREPDLLFVGNEHADRLRETYIYGPADLVIEIVSPDSDERDRGEKFVEYETAGIPEYWLIDPLRREATFYRRGADERYHPEPLEADGVYRSLVLPGFRLRVEWLWQRPLPPVAELARQLEA